MKYFTLLWQFSKLAGALILRWLTTSLVFLVIWGLGIGDSKAICSEQESFLGDTWILGFSLFRKLDVAEMLGLGELSPRRTFVGFTHAACQNKSISVKWRKMKKAWCYLSHSRPDKWKNAFKLKSLEKVRNSIFLKTCQLKYLIFHAKICDLKVFEINLKN